jgi:four helix bundle protein
MFNFEKLDVWQEGIVFADSVYSVTRSFPAEERFGLTSQMRRAAVSVPSNIAEGASRMSQADYGRFIEFSAGSLFEVVSNSFITKKQNFLPDNGFGLIYRDAEELSRMLSGLPGSLSQISSCDALNFQPSTV